MQPHGGQQSLVERYTQTQPLSAEQLRARLEHLQGLLATLYQSTPQQGMHPGASATFQAPVTPAVHMVSQHAIHGPAVYKGLQSPPLLPPLSARRTAVLSPLCAQAAAALPPLSVRTRPPLSSAKPHHSMPPASGLQGRELSPASTAPASTPPAVKGTVPKPIFNLLRAAMKPKLPSAFTFKSPPKPGGGSTQQAAKNTSLTPTILQTATAVRSRAVTPPPAGSLPTPSSINNPQDTRRLASGPAGAHGAPAAGDTLQLLADMAEMMSPLPGPNKQQHTQSNKQPEQHATVPASVPGAAQNADAQPSSSSAGVVPAAAAAGNMEVDKDAAAAGGGGRKRARGSTPEQPAEQAAAAPGGDVNMLEQAEQESQAEIPPQKRSRPSKATSTANQAAAQNASAERKKEKWARPVKGYTSKQEVKDLLNKTLEIPGPVFGVDVPDLYYRARVIGPDKQHAQAVVIRMADDKAKYFFPIGQAREWLHEMQARHASQPLSVSPHTTSDRSDAFAAEVLAQLSGSRTNSGHTQGAAHDSGQVGKPGQDGHTSKRQWQST